MRIVGDVYRWCLPGSRTPGPSSGRPLWSPPRPRQTAPPPALPHLLQQHHSSWTAVAPATATAIAPAGGGSPWLRRRARRRRSCPACPQRNPRPPGHRARRTHRRTPVQEKKPKTQNLIIWMLCVLLVGYILIFKFILHWRNKRNGYIYI